MSVGCTCGDQRPKCAACIAQVVMWLGGAAKTRGEEWARRVATAAGTDHDWPPYEGRCAAIAQRQVAGLIPFGDAGEVDALARKCHAFAARTWEQLRATGGAGGR